MIQEVSTDELKQHIKNDTAIVIDTLARDSYDHHHIPGAVHNSYQKDYSPKDMKDGKMVDIETRFLQNFEEHIGAPRGAYIITYSGSRGCGLSYMAAMCLVRAGYTNVHCYRAGLRGWKASNGSFEKNV